MAFFKGVADRARASLQSIQASHANTKRQQQLKSIAEYRTTRETMPPTWLSDFPPAPNSTEAEAMEADQLIKVIANISAAHRRMKNLVPELELLRGINDIEGTASIQFYAPPSNRPSYLYYSERRNMTEAERTIYAYADIFKLHRILTQEERNVVVYPCLRRTCTEAISPFDLRRLSTPSHDAKDVALVGQMYDFNKAAPFPQTFDSFMNIASNLGKKRSIPEANRLVRDIQAAKERLL